ncbi:hypothetical protein [Paenirhodobacter enshiensis]|uniref:tetratricopeptide repeat protein n=1 Tax=Paenirhodobacter enshiensis TaxID=1105367 RepID=UPI003FA2A1AA
MSAIDWLSSSVGPSSGGEPAAGSAAPRPGSVQILGRASSAVLPPVPGETPVTPVIRTETISEISLDHPPPNAVGLVSAPRTGVPIDFWGATPEADLAASVRKERLDTLPAIQSFLMQILLAELEPPQTPSPEGRDVLFLARIDRLLDMGALDQAVALLDQADPDDPEVFRRRFDVALLQGREDGACRIMTETPAVTPSFPARIFCLARRGDWPAAALSLDTGRALGQIDPEMAELLARFLDPELTEDSPDLPPPARPTPLVFRMMEAIGQPISTSTLPVAFAQADLEANHGRKAEIEAAERLTRSGVLDPNRLLGLYTGQRASASGGVWDRVTLVSAFDKALSAGNAARVSQLLPALWDEMQAQELEPAMAAMFAERLRGVALDDDAAAIAFRLGLLTPDFAAVAGARTPADADEALLIGIAQGDTSAHPAQDRMGLMLKTVFDARPKAIPARYAGLLPDKLGEAVLDAIDDVTEGARGDLRRVGDGLMLLRATGFETVARRAALELVVLERNG